MNLKWLIRILICTLIIPTGSIFAEQNQTKSQIVQTTTATQPAAQTDSGNGLTDFQTMGYGCLIGGAGILAASAAVGALPVIMVFSGYFGPTPAASVLWTSLVMGVGAQTCSAAGLAAPFIVHAWNTMWTDWQGTKP